MMGVVVVRYRVQNHAYACGPCYKSVAKRVLWSSCAVFKDHRDWGGLQLFLMRRIECALGHDDVHGDDD